MMEGSFKRLLMRGGIGYAPESNALFARMTSAPSASRKAAIDELITSLKDAGVWEKLDFLQVYAAHDSQAATLNWVSASYTATPVSSPNWTADVGYATNGTNQCINTGFRPTLSSLSGLNDAAMGLWVVKARERPELWFSNSADATQSVIWGASDTQFYAGLNHTSLNADLFTSGENIHLLSVDRSGSATANAYTMEQSFSSSRASVGVVNAIVTVNAQGAVSGVGGLYSAATVGAAFYGRSLGAVGHAAVQDALRVYMQEIGNYMVPAAMWGDSRTSGSAGQTTVPNLVLSQSGNKRVVYNGGVSGETSTQIKNRMVADTTRKALRTQIIWAGYNNRTSPSTVLADIATMVADAEANSAGRYLVLTIPPSRLASQYAGTSEGINLATINSAILSTYGSKAVDVSALLVGSDPNGVTQAAYVIDTVTDPIHFNTTANGLMATAIENALVANGW